MTLQFVSIRSIPHTKDLRFTHYAARYAVSELQADVDRLVAGLAESEREVNQTQFAIFVGAFVLYLNSIHLMDFSFQVHNKLKPKTGTLPEGIPYFSGEEIPDVWCTLRAPLFIHLQPSLICHLREFAVEYPWEQK
jgi:hypothetical protein